MGFTRSQPIMCIFQQRQRQLWWPSGAGHYYLWGFWVRAYYGLNLNDWTVFNSCKQCNANQTNMTKPKLYCSHGIATGSFVFGSRSERLFDKSHQRATDISWYKSQVCTSNNPSMSCHNHSNKVYRERYRHWPWGKKSWTKWENEKEEKRKTYSTSS